MDVSYNYRQDIAAVSRVPSIDTLLEVACRNSGMGFAAVARVTKERWVACGVRDGINLGLIPGDEIDIQATICNEIRQSKKAIVIEDVTKDRQYCDHPGLSAYRFQSYISVPIIKKGGEFFGTLCAVDKMPHLLRSVVITGMFTLFAELIAFYLDALESSEDQHILLSEKINTETLESDSLQRNKVLEEKNSLLEEINDNLQSIAYMSSRDLQAPLRKITLFSKIIFEKEAATMSNSSREYFVRMQNVARRMEILIKDLLDYSQLNNTERKFELTDLSLLLREIKLDLKEELEYYNGQLEYMETCPAMVIPFQMLQLFYNLISNSLKFSFAHRPPLIKISSEIVRGNSIKSEGIIKDRDYCHISVSDNGIGFEAKNNEKIFKIFERLHPAEKYQGTGIGLGIVKKVVDNHIGIILANGILHGGATFDVYLPL